MPRRAYSRLCITNAQTVLARMLDYAVNDLKYDIDDFFALFIKSGIADSFGVGNPKYTVGMSGVELAWETLYVLGMYREDLPRPAYTLDRSPEYWTGWALAYYQWYSNMTFENIIAEIPISRIRNLYYPCHEMDIRQFIDRMNEIIERNHQESHNQRPDPQ